MRQYLERSEKYLTETLLPFWAERAVESTHGGFQTNYDRKGRRTAVTEKSMLSQARCVFAFSHAARLGFEWDECLDAITQGIDFLFLHFRDRQHDGYFWITEEDGHVKDNSKTIYGHSFLIYAFAEHALSTGDLRSANEACRLFDLLMAKAADIQYGGFFEHFTADWRLQAVRQGGLHKSLDSHMHLMEAFTTLYELTGAPRHRQALEQITELIFSRMIDPQTGCGVAMFEPDWTPINNVQLDTLWGADRFDDEGKPPEITSYGHNIELAWLYLHNVATRRAAGDKTCDCDRALERVMPIFEHTHKHGVDWERGGLFVEGHRRDGVTENTKEFWQQGEAMVGFLDAYTLTADEKYLDAFRNIHDFVFEKMINWDCGEWYLLLDRDGRPVIDDMGTSWKVLYHTIRSMCLVVTKLRAIEKSRQA